MTAETTLAPVEQKTPSMGRGALGMSLAGLVLFLLTVLLGAVEILAWLAVLPLLGGFVTGIVAVTKDAGRKAGVWAVVVAVIPGHFVAAAAIYFVMALSDLGYPLG